MDSFIAILHIVVALVLIALVLVQDSKSGGAGGAFGGGGSNSVLGATGAATLAQKLTRWTAVIFALTSIGLSVEAARSNRSVMDSLPAAAAATPPPVLPTTGATAPAPGDATTPAPATPAPATNAH